MAAAWDDSPAAGAGGGWDNNDTALTGGGWNADSTNEETFTGEFNEQNVSKHAGPGHQGDDGCRICGDLGHFARDCPDKKPNTGECFNCGEVGHNKADCPNPRVEREFTGDCRICGKPGHRAIDCEDKPPVACKICKAEGHIAKDCEVNRVHHELSALAIESLDAKKAWELVVLADKEKEIEDIKKAILAYSKFHEETTLPEIEKHLRDDNMNTFLIAKEQEVADTHTIINLQGKPGQKYVLSFQFSAAPRRAKFAQGWPASKEENLARLAEAGFVMDGLIVKCSNCKELGHISKNCEQEKQQHELVAKCANCDADGHRARDCTEPRKSNKKGCRICEEEGHMAKDCPQREAQKCRNCGEEGHRAAECTNERVLQCRNCDGMGHTAKECDKPRDMSRITCRNCDEAGHVSRDCPKPTDWSRVECSNCHEKGHSYKRCPNEAKTSDDIGGGSGWEANDTAGGDGAGGQWENSVAEPTGGESTWNVGGEVSSGGW